MTIPETIAFSLRETESSFRVVSVHRLSLLVAFDLSMKAQHREFVWPISYLFFSVQHLGSDKAACSPLHCSTAQWASSSGTSQKQHYCRSTLPHLLVATTCDLPDVFINCQFREFENHLWQPCIFCRRAKSLEFTA